MHFMTFHLYYETLIKSSQILLFPGLLSRDNDSDDESDDLTNFRAADLDLSDDTQISRTESENMLDDKIVNMGEDKTIVSSSKSVSVTSQVSEPSNTTKNILNKKSAQNSKLKIEKIKKTVIQSTASLCCPHPSGTPRRSSICRGTSPIKTMLPTAQVQDITLYLPPFLPTLLSTPMQSNPIHPTTYY
jgi:hypothetical protein